MDREARDPFELMENIETILGIKTYPMNWPIGCGKEFKGVFDRDTRKVLAFESDGRANGVKMVDEITAELGAPEMDELIGAANHQKLADDIELLDGAAEEFDLDAVQHGQLSPVFFGSALTNFGVEPFLKEFLHLTPPPLPRKDAPTGDVVDPCSEQFSGFVFKIQANMNKNHRDRIAFLRICSGKFERGMEAFHVQEGKNIKLATGTSLMADDRAIVDEAYAGDIIGLFDPGIFSIGDTLCTGKQHVQFAGIPTFAPEHFARVTQVDTMKRKQFVKGMEQIAQEGAIQIFRDLGSGMEEVIVGVVGVLQLEVLEYRLRNEYNVDIRMQTLPYEHLRWIMNDPDELDPKTLDLTSDTRCIEDLKGNHLLLFGSPWSINWAEQHNEQLKLSEFGNLTF
jgi:peptide chain release factor 3